ncbi:hypothetical protein [Mycolicibacterium grossiae]|uniref:hypothetical protein n=1 Tax=Mycolicibacterium grossiae TaxID=1552759 RepID=UPI0011F10F75|nr:hypothetical protein [Mycolicibacterium grossiae]QEM43563.1 hypothetical protein FZ046_01125 [Mycolicibacterium grossiae]
MRFFAQDYPAVGSYETTKQHRRTRQTAAYTEVESISSDGTYHVVHLRPLSGDVVVVCACFDQWFTPLQQAMARSDATKDAWMSSMQSAWPTTKRLFEDGWASRYSGTALCTMQDPDDISDKWFVLTVVANLNLAVSEDETRLIDAFHRVEAAAAALHHEVSSRRMDFAALASREMRNELFAATKKLAGFATANFGPIAGFFKGG